MKHFSFFLFLLQKQHVTRKRFGLQGMWLFSLVDFPLISWSWLKIWQLGVGLLILVPHYRVKISFRGSLSNESYCTSGSGHESSPLEEPLNAPNPNIFSFSEDVLDVMSASFSDVMEQTVAWRSFKWHSILLIKIVCGLLMPVTHSIWYFEVHQLGFLPNTVSYVVQHVLFSMLWQKSWINSFHSDLMDHLSKCSNEGGVVFWCDIIPIDCLHIQVLLPGMDSLNTTMTSLNYTIACKNICTSKAELVSLTE